MDRDVLTMCARDDMVIEDLATSEAELRDALNVVTADCEAYRMLAQQAIQALHDLTRERDRLRNQRPLRAVRTTSSTSLNLVHTERTKIVRFKQRLEDELYKRRYALTAARITA